MKNARHICITSRGDNVPHALVKQRPRAQTSPPNETIYERILAALHQYLGLKEIK